MGKVLKITDTKGTNHIVPMANKSFWLGYNNRSKPNERVKIEVIDESEAAEVPYKDPNWVNPVAAQAQVGDLKKTVEAKDAQIEALMKQLEALQNPLPVVPIAPEPIGPAPIQTEDFPGPDVKDFEPIPGSEAPKKPKGK